MSQSSFQIARRVIRDAISIGTYGYLARWLWNFNREFGSLRNMMTMLYGFVCLVWTPRFTPRSVSFGVFAVGVYGVLVKILWWNVNRDYLGLICKTLSALFGCKSVHLVWGLVSELIEDE